MSHLVLGLIVVTTSWVGWSCSIAPGNQRPLSQIFEWPFWVLLIDLMLVIVYFILLSKSEVAAWPENIEDLSPTKRSPGGKFVSQAAPEALWIFVMFLVYFLWDVIADLVLEIRKLSLRRKGIRLYVSLFCAILSILGWISLQTQESLVNPDQAVVCFDIFLIALILLFRRLKNYESLFEEVFITIEQNNVTNQATRLRLSRDISIWLAALLSIR